MPVDRPIGGGVVAAAMRLAHRQAGFTLLELLVVVAILGLLAAFVGPRYFGQLGKSETGVATAQVRSFVDALDAYRVDMGRYPTTQEGLAALVDRPADQRWRGPYLRKSIPLDPWGRQYVYRSPGQGGAEYDLMSLGKDGAPGGGGADADIRP